MLQRKPGRLPVWRAEGRRRLSLADGDRIRLALPARPRVDAALLLVATLLLAPPLGAQRLFVGGDPFPLQSFGTALRVDDFNSDGRPDVAVAHGERGSLSVLLGAPVAPLLGEPRVYNAGLGVVYVTSRDVSGDGFPDILAVNAGSSSLSVLINNGDGTFLPGVEYGVGLQPRVAELGDFNGDGRVDVVTTNVESSDVHVLAGDGAGGFTSSGRVTVGDNPHHLSVNDFDGDGALDVAVAHSDALTWFRIRGNGSFEQAGAIPIAPDPRIVAGGDFDGDGDADLAVVTDTGDVLCLVNPGDGRFEVRPVGAVFGFSFNRAAVGVLVAVDFEDDGFVDVISPFSTAEGESGIQVFHGSRNDPLSRSSRIVLDAPAADVGFADFTGNGFHDALFARSDEPELVLVRSAGPGRLSSRTGVPLGVGPRALVALEADGNAGPRMIALSGTSLIRLMADGSGGLRVDASEEFPRKAFHDMVAGDFDGDGNEELALIDIAGPSAVVVSFAAGGVMAATRDYALGALPAQIVAADFDRDGILDFAVADQAFPRITVILRPGLATHEVVELPLEHAQTAIAAGDLDGDGTPDLAAYAGPGLRAFLGDGAGGFPRSFALDGFRPWRRLAIADLDGDGGGELIVPDPAGNLSVLSGVREGAEPRRQEIAVGGDLRPIDAVDVDGDGRLDLVTAHEHAAVVLLQQADGAFAPPERFAVGSSPRAVAFFDVNSDGRLDLATADFGSRALSILLATPGPATDALFRRGDANSDGALDLTDAVVLLQQLFGGGAALACADAADVDDDGSLTLTDVVRVLAYFYGAGDRPPPPGPEQCGVDPSPDTLASCRSDCPPAP